MTAMPEAVQATARYAAVSRQRVLRGLYWHEWFAHGSGLILLASMWLIAQWVLMLVVHPIVVLIAGVFVALWLGGMFAGADAHEGAEEFALALPAMRSQRYWVRLTMSLPVLVGLVGVSLAAIAWDWPQAVWRVFVETGFTEPMTAPKRAEDLHPGLYYVLAAACPLAAYGVAFGMASLATTREQVALAGLFGALYTGAGVLVGLSIEERIWRFQPHAMHGLYSAGILVALAGLYLAAGYFGYRRKDGIARPSGTYSVEWRVALALAGALLLVLVMVPVVLAVVIRLWQ